MSGSSRRRRRPPHCTAPHRTALLHIAAHRCTALAALVSLYSRPWVRTHTPSSTHRPLPRRQQQTDHGEVWPKSAPPAALRPLAMTVTIDQLVPAVGATFGQIAMADRHGGRGGKVRGRCAQRRAPWRQRPALTIRGRRPLCPLSLCAQDWPCVCSAVVSHDYTASCSGSYSEHHSHSGSLSRNSVRAQRAQRQRGRGATWPP